jgi:hypothetical protein
MFYPKGSWNSNWYNYDLRLSGVIIEMISNPLTSSTLLPPLFAFTLPGARSDLLPPALVVWWQALFD